jgi:two-component system, cell cycle response regulator DivK
MEQAGKKQALTVMVVDDSDDLRELMVFQLQRLGYQTIEAANGQEAIDLARKAHPSLILMDINMPVLDGLAATRIIRGNGQLRDTAIVAFSAHQSVGNRENALAAGCNAYVSKPECVSELPRVVKRFAPLV